MAAAFAFVLLLPGCFLQTVAAAKTRAVTDLRCDEQSIVITELGGGAFQATGCARTVTYVCSAGEYTTTSCIREKGPEPVAAATAEVRQATAAAPPRDGPTEAAMAKLRGTLDQYRADILTCVGAERAAVWAKAAPDGSVALGLRPPQAGSAEDGCVGHALSTVRAEATPRGFEIIHLVR